jgi:integrase
MIVHMCLRTSVGHGWDMGGSTMPQRIRSGKLGSRSARLRLPVRGKPYFVKLSRGLALGYRRTKTAGTWVVRVTHNGSDWTQAIGTADDHEEIGPGILTFEAAQALARVIAQGGEPDGDSSVQGALDRYEADLTTRGGDVNNAKRVRCHLTEKLAKKIVGSLTAGELREWRDKLATKMTRASVIRTTNALKAALNRTADTDERITNRDAWKVGLKALDAAGESRNIILTEPQVQAIVAAAYRDSDAFGEFVNVIAVTGARPSQAARLQGDDLQCGDDANKWQPRLMMPTSRKGRGVKKITHRLVPITEALARHLAGRRGTLLLQSDGSPWGGNSHSVGFAKIVKAAGLDPSVVTIYALRHTSIVRQLLANVPARVVAALHDTSVAMIEQTYSKHIADHADDLARATLPETTPEILRFDSQRASA